MKILALNGSHRGQHGCTQLLLDKIAQGAKEAGAEFETVVLARHKILPCTGCETCHTPESYLKCIYEKEDDFTSISEKMKAADILIYATPVYVFNVSGIMKIFLDRFNSTVGTGKLGVTQSGLFFGEVDKKLHSKPFVILTCCGNIEDETTKNVVSYFNTFAKFLDAPVVGTLVRKSVGVLEPGKEPETEKQKRLIADVEAAYIQAGRELAMEGSISSATARRANRNLLGIPLLTILMKFRWFKQMAVKNANRTANVSAKPEAKEHQE